MLQQRREKKFEEVEDEMRAFWRWYGLDLMVKVSHKDWPWSKKDYRRMRYMDECVSESDEALALQVLSLRGMKYIELRDERARAEDSGSKPPPKKKGKIAGEDTMGGTCDVFIQYHKLVEKAHAAKDNGWCEYLMEEQKEMEQRKGSKKKGRGGSGLNNLVLPFDKKIDLPIS